MGGTIKMNLTEKNIYSILRVAYAEGMLQGHKNERSESITKTVEEFTHEYATKELKRLKLMIAEIENS
jgi:hypothetical protein